MTDLDAPDPCGFCHHDRRQHQTIDYGNSTRGIGECDVLGCGCAGFSGLPGFPPPKPPAEIFETRAAGFVVVVEESLNIVLVRPGRTPADDVRLTVTHVDDLVQALYLARGAVADAEMAEALARREARVGEAAHDDDDRA